jgi:polysaccharide pyruvyl transferase WcaK-like protein
MRPENFVFQEAAQPQSYPLTQIECPEFCFSLPDLTGLLGSRDRMATSQSMRMIIDNGAHTLRNMGDVAMLQVTIQRIRNLHPQAVLFALTSQPDLLARYCPGVQPLSPQSRDAAYLPAPQVGAWTKAWRALRGRSRPLACSRDFQTVFAEADGVVLAGGGFLNDENPRQTRTTLGMLADAISRRKTVALFGQGLGPMENPQLLQCLREVCRGAPIGLRESRRGPELLQRAGAVPGRVAVTGDDAVEIAWGLPSPPPGDRTGLGVSVRQVDYSGIAQKHLGLLSAVVRTLRTKLKAPLVPLPVSFNSYEDDPRAIAAVTGAPYDCHGLDDPLSLIRSAGTCRMVLTGTYHSAVFALSQGVPCLAFYASDYYRDKMEGLADQFPVGCVLVDLRAEGAASGLVARCEALWNQASGLGAPLLAAAAAQVLKGKEFYRQALGITAR